MVVYLEPHSFDDLGVLATGQLAVFLGLGPCDDHLSAAENQACGFWVAKSHDNGGKPVWVVFGGLAFPGDLLEVKLAS